MSLVSGRTAYRAALALSIVTLLVLVWLSLGVGIIGEDGDPANVVYGLVVVIGIVGAVAARLRPHGMARTLGAMALALAAVGLFSVMAYVVTQRTHEIGIRMAMGAHAGDVLRLVLGDGLKLALVGIASGLLVSLAMAPVIASSFSV